MAVMVQPIMGNLSGGGTDYEQLVNYTMLYDASGECEVITGGWVKTYKRDGANGTATKNSDNLYILGTSGSSYSDCGFATANTIDDTDQKVNAIGIWTKYFELRAVSGTGNLGIGNYPGYAVAETVTSKTLKTIPAFIDNRHLFLCSGNSERPAYYYNIFLTKPDNYQKLCEIAGVTAPSSLEELIVDTTALATIFNNDDASQFMIKQCTGDFMASVCNSAEAMALLCDSIAYDKAFNNEHWYKFMTMIPTSLAAMDNVAITVPTMTSNTEPSGIASATCENNEGTGTEYYAFDKSIEVSTSRRYFYANTISAPFSVEYEFPSPCVVYKASATYGYEGAVSYTPRAYNFECYDEASKSWIDVSGTIIADLGETKDVIFNKLLAAKKWRMTVTVTGNTGSTNKANNTIIRELQFYGKVVE